MPRRGGGGHGHSGGHAPRFRHARPRFIRRRPIVVGGGYVWNGLYWVSPQGLCYTKDDEGQYTLVDCAPVPVVVSEFIGTEGSSAETGKGGTGGTMDSSMFEGLREGGPLNKKNIRDTLIGVGIGILIFYAYKKFKK